MSMKDKPTFSIIVPVYQSELFLKKTVKKLQNQTFSNIEIVLVDDGSTDKSPEICDELAINDDRIISIHKKNGGSSSARNKGIEVSNGEWIIFVDSDDIVSEVMCENFENYINKYDNLDFITCNFAKNKENLLKRANGSNEVYSLEDSRQNISLAKQMLLSKYDSFSSFFNYSFGNNVVLNSPCAKAYRKSFLSTNGLKFHTNIIYSEDLLFNIEVLLKRAVGIFADDKIYFYYQNDNSVSHQAYMPNLIKNYYYFKQIASKSFKKEQINSLESALDIYTFRMAMGVLLSDIFRPGATFNESKERMRYIRASQKFKYICNWSIFIRYKKYFDRSTQVKALLLLKGNFFINYVICKLFQKVKGN